MTAASYWSLLAPAIEMAERSGSYGDDGQWAFIPVAIGFTLGAAFVYGADVFMPYLVKKKMLEHSSYIFFLSNYMKQVKLY
jgi:zinc transporter 11